MVGISTNKRLQFIIKNSFIRPKKMSFQDNCSYSNQIVEFATGKYNFSTKSYC